MQLLHKMILPSVVELLQKDKKLIIMNKFCVQNGFYALYGMFIIVWILKIAPVTSL